METLLDIVGVGLFIWGVLWAIGTLFRLFLGYNIARQFEVGRAGSIVAGVLVALISAGIAAFLMWAGHEVWNVERL